MLHAPTVGLGGGVQLELAQQTGLGWHWGRRGERAVGNLDGLGHRPGRNSDGNPVVGEQSATRVGDDLGHGSVVRVVRPVLPLRLVLPLRPVLPLRLVLPLRPVLPLQPTRLGGRQGSGQRLHG
ncbi:MAG: hypothetical protein E6I75_24180 [Chloroflexi bacterium]|nr:MAG: hypothetical protein E6I75_24180 [Chloroflexota bacterium]